MSRVIEIHAKKWWNPDLNPGLAQAIQKARQNGVTRDIIEKAVKKWSGQLSTAAYVETYYEWYGPGACAIYVKTLTDNTNRTATNIRVCMQRYHGSFGEPGSVAWQFQQKWVIVVSGKVRIEQIKGNETEFVDPYDADQLEMDAIELWAEDIETEDSICTITTSKEHYFTIDNALARLWYKIIQSDIECICDTTVSLSGEDQALLDTLIEKIEEDDDVEKVWTNCVS